MAEHLLNERCPLCHSNQAARLYTGGKVSACRDFLHCGVCDMVFVPRCQLISEDAQRERYLQHNNDVDDPDYRAFLGRLYYELKPYLSKRAKGLDYGAGPGPALVAMMREDGFDARMYDIFFHPDESALEDTYDFITCTETAEHFTDPAREFGRLEGMLKRPGWLGVMTGMLDDWSSFPSWHYHRDPTHVCFYSRKTMLWIANRYVWEAVFPRENVILFHKSSEIDPLRHRW